MDTFQTGSNFHIKMCSDIFSEHFEKMILSSKLCVCKKSKTLNANSAINSKAYYMRFALYDLEVFFY